MTARLRKLFANKGFRKDCDKGFADKGGFDGLRDVVYDLGKDLMEGFGVDLLKGLDENFLRRSLSVIRGKIFGSNTLNKDAEVRDLRGT